MTAPWSSATAISSSGGRGRTEPTSSTRAAPGCRSTVTSARRGRPGTATSSSAGPSTTSGGPRTLTGRWAATSARSPLTGSRRARTRKLGVDRDLDVALEGLRDRAVVLRALGRFAERRLVDPVDLAFDLEVDPGHAEAGVGFVEGRGRARLEARRRVAVLGERVRERHRDAARMGGRDQLLRAHALGVLGARRPAHALLGERVAAGRDRAGAAH